LTRWPAGSRKVIDRFPQGWVGGGREPSGVLVLTVRGDRIQAVHVIGDPRQLRLVSSQLG